MTIDNAAEIKVSRRPDVQKRVDEQISKINNRYPEVPINAVTTQARDRVASEITRDRLQKKLKEAEATSMIDALTGVKSRRWFDETLEEQTADASRIETAPLYMIMSDFDRFDEVNNAFGHAVGDKVLTLIRDLEPRTGEPIARYGGDEFVQLIRRELSEEDLASMMKRYRSKIAERSSDILRNVPMMPESKVSTPLRIATLSFGITRYVPGESSEKFRVRTDMALYHVKNSGRNSCAIAIPGNESVGEVTFIDVPNKNP